ASASQASSGGRPSAERAARRWGFRRSAGEGTGPEPDSWGHTSHEEDGWGGGGGGGARPSRAGAGGVACGGRGRVSARGVAREGVGGARWGGGEGVWGGWGVGGSTGP